MIISLLFLNLILQILNLCLNISILRTEDSNSDLLLDLERNQRRFIRRVGKK